MSAASTDPDTRDSIRELPLSQLVLGAHQPRKRFEAAALEELTVSIRTWGVLQPILVRPVSAANNPERFEIVAGERRYFAAQRAGRATIPAVIRPMDDREALEVALLENLQRRDLTEIEEAEGLLRLLSVRLERSVAETVSLLYRMDNEAKAKVSVQVLGSPAGKLIEATFAAVGKLTWQSFIATRLPLLKLPADLLEALRAGEVSPIRARLLARVRDLAERQAIFATSTREGWSNAQLREHIMHAASTPAPALRPEPPALMRLRTLAASLVREDLWHNLERRHRVEQLVHELERLLDEESSDAEPQPLPVRDGARAAAL